MVHVALGTHDESESEYERDDDPHQGAEERGLAGFHQVVDLRLETHREQKEDHTQLGHGVDDRIDSAAVIAFDTGSRHPQIQELHQREVADHQVGDDDTHYYLPDETGQTEARDQHGTRTGQRIQHHQSHEDLKKILHAPAFFTRIIRLRIESLKPTTFPFLG